MTEFAISFGLFGMLLIIALDFYLVLLSKDKNLFSYTLFYVVLSYFLGYFTSIGDERIAMGYLSFLIIFFVIKYIVSFLGFLIIRRITNNIISYIVFWLFTLIVSYLSVETYDFILRLVS
jgi:hypothetical protein